MPFGQLVKIWQGGPKTPEQVYKKYLEDWKRMEVVVKNLKAQKHLESLAVSVVIVL